MEERTTASSIWGSPSTDAQPHHMGWHDYLIFSLTLLVSLVVGVYFALTGGRQKSTTEYLSGNRELGMVPVSLSMFMSGVSAIMLLGMTAEVYEHGMLRWIGAVAFIFGAAISAFVFVPLFYPLRIASVFEYYEARYKSRTVQLVGCAVLLVSQVLYIGLTLYTPAVALEAVTGIPMWVSLLSTAAIGTTYTTIGGMKAVVWTDAVQGVIMLGGLITVLVMGTIKAGGVTSVIDTAREGNRLNFFIWDPNPFLRMNTWSVLLSHFLDGCIVATLQTSVQRICSTRSLGHARGTVLLLAPMFLVTFTLCMSLGLVIYAHYQQTGCDPVSAGHVTSVNQIFPYFIVTALRIPCLPGLLLATLFSGALSSFSSSINACAAVVWKDLLERPLRHWPPPRQALLTKALAAGFGALGTAFAFIYPHFAANVSQVWSSLLAGVEAPLAGMTLLGCLCPFANWMGALAGGVSSFAFTFSIGLATNIMNVPRENPLPPVAEYNCWLNLNSTTTAAITATTIATTSADTATSDAGVGLSFMLYSPLGLLICLVVGIIVSLLTARRGDRGGAELTIYTHLCAERREQGDRPQAAKEQPIHSHKAPDEAVPLSDMNTGQL